VIGWRWQVRAVPGTAPRGARPPAAAAAAGHHGDELRDAFQVFDKDKDGFLGATDLRSVFNQLIR